MNRRGFFGRLMAGLGGAVAARYFSVKPAAEEPLATVTTWTVTTNAADPKSFRITDEYGRVVSGGNITFTASL